MKNVAVLGAGNIGSLISVLLSNYVENDYNVHLLSAHFQGSLEDYNHRGIHAVAFNVADSDALGQYVKDNDIHAIVSALPYSLNKDVANVAAENGVHYFDLTEDVSVKNHLVALSKMHGKKCPILMPQCGLAPGFINIVGAHLIRQFEHVHEAKIRVGALPQTVSNSLKYNLTWSTNGLVNEYGNPCEAIVGGFFVDDLPPLEGIESTLIDGVEYEAFNTSGGLGTLAETFGEACDNLNYKTMRYPGHCEKIKFLMDDLDLNDDRETLERILESAIPTTTQDVIVIYASVSGISHSQFTEKSYTLKVYPKHLVYKDWAGIQVTTAAGVCAALDITLNDPDKYKGGFVKQEDIDFDVFMNNRFGKLYA